MGNKLFKIALIEDDPLIVELYETTFKSINYEVDHAFDGEAGLAMLKAMPVKPDLVLSDIMMPKMNGLDLLSAMKADASLKFIPVIFLTNLAHEHDIQRGLELGAVTYLEKSKYTPREVVNKVKEVLEAGPHANEVPDVKVMMKHPEN